MSRHEEDVGAKYEIKAYGQFSFCHPFKPRAFAGSKGDDGSPPKYQSALLIPKKDKKTYNEILDVIEDAIVDKLGKDGKVPRSKWFIKDGDVLAEESGREECAGHWVISASNGRAPLVVDKDGDTELVEKDGKPYSGSFGYMVFRAWVQDNQFGKRVNASLEGLQFMKDGPAFGAAPLSKSRFKDERDEDERDDDRKRRRSREDEDDDRSARRSREDEDDDRSARRRSRDEDEDEKPARRRSRDEDEDERPARRRRDEDEDERPSRRRSRDEDEDDDRPVRRRSRDEDEDDDRPARRRRM